MKMLLTADRIRAALDDARTEKDVVLSLRAHKIKFSYDTSAGFMAFRIPARSGVVLVYRTASRSAPFIVRHEKPSFSPAPYMFPVYRSDY